MWTKIGWELEFGQETKFIYPLSHSFFPFLKNMLSPVIIMVGQDLDLSLFIHHTVEVPSLFYSWLHCFQELSQNMNMKSTIY